MFDRGVLAAILFFVLSSGCSLTGFRAADSLRQARNSDGLVPIRFEMGTKGKEVDLEVRLAVEAARVAKIRGYFFEQGEDLLLAERMEWKCRTTNRYYSSSPADQQDVDVVVVWVDGATAASIIKAEVNGEDFSFKLGELAEQGEITREIDGAYISVNLLYDNEIGYIKPEQAGINDAGEDFGFAVFCDAHAGRGHPLFNSFVERNIDVLNELEQRPAFLLINGDSVTGQGDKEHFEVLESLLAKCRTPVLLELGNHETRYASTFTPDYNMAAMGNYIAAQKKINGVNKILYSFDLGKWHFVVWPDPLRRHFWQRHPHYFDWLDNDLRKNKDRPTIFFQHVHSLPIGINPMTNYVNSVQERRELLDILARYGNVKYVLSGHTHITLKASMKTAREYKGITFINLPPTFSPGRNFGEADFGGDGPAGFTVVGIRGDKATINYRMLDGQVYGYPARFAQFEPDRWPLWLKEEWELPANEKIVNGGFEDGLAGWSRQFVYMEDENLSNVCEAVTTTRHSGDKSLHLFSRRRGYYVPGDNRMTQTINEICQPVNAKADSTPIVRLMYLLDANSYTRGDLSGACVRVEGYRQSGRRMRLCYWIGTAYFKPRGLWSTWEEYLHYDITAAPDKWHEVVVNPKRDYERASKNSYDALELDRLVVTLQVWNLNQHTEQDTDKPMRIGVHFDDIEILPDGGEQVSMVDDKVIDKKPESEIESRWLLGGMSSEERSKK